MIKVYLQKPWKSSDSPYYKFLKESPPSGVKYINLNDASNLIQKRGLMKINDILKKIIKKIIRCIYPSMPNAHYTRSVDGCDIIHCAHCLSKNKYPWICNMEYVGQFWASGGPPRLNYRKGIYKFLRSPYCKSIVVWTEWAKRDIIEYFPGIKNKIKVVYPGVPRQNLKKVKSNKIRLLFISRKFYFKGGLYAIEAMDRLTKKYDNVEGVVISDIPEEVTKKYSRNKNLKLFGMMPQERVFREFYSTSNIFVYPSFNDTLGFPILEAMSFGLPVVGAERNSRSELIEDGKSGFLIKTLFGDAEIPYYMENLQMDLISGIVDKTELLIRESSIRKKMSKKCLKLFTPGGRFSIERRNKELKKIYGEAIKNGKK